jgi:stage V sporulation protein D (sporulation-specific penicillin-binding protein)
MEISRIYHRKKITLIFLGVFLCGLLLIGRLVYLMIFRSGYYTDLATELQQRERDIKAARGKITDRNGVVLATNTSVCTISVIHNQITDAEAVIAMLSDELGLSEETVRKRVEKVSSIERIKSNVDKETGDRILAYGYDGVKVDEDYKRVYPYDELASKVIGFTGSDNQGILGLEVKYDEYLSGTDGKILTYTDARGVEVENAPEDRIEPVAGNTLVTSLDYNIQMYCEQAAQKAYIQKEADGVDIIVMNPQNGEIYAMVDYPEYNLNDPFTLTDDYAEYAGTEEESTYQNLMWRNWCISDTYEPGSIFKIITTSIALEEDVVQLDENFYCPG